MFSNHQQVSNSRFGPHLFGPNSGLLRDDAFARLVRQVHDDPHNPFNVDRFLWVLEEPAPQACGGCGWLFDPWRAYDGSAARGSPRRYCSLRCRNRAAYLRHRAARPATRRRWAA